MKIFQMSRRKRQEGFVVNECEQPLDIASVACTVDLGAIRFYALSNVNIRDVF